MFLFPIDGSSSCWSVVWPLFSLFWWYLRYDSDLFLDFRFKLLSSFSCSIDLSYFVCDCYFSYMSIFYDGIFLTELTYFKRGLLVLDPSVFVIPIVGECIDE